ncbi:head GIN domain-containing protein [Marinoscillum sp. MHG1-6]|uniref:head GIN domain-containing protein n=1 Tax=Marinoscillum sp. MHG1-6 TaxID=2959627 RepID=UPI0021586B9F|nr:head GIN domain-containing protein [Marinoscillum sp. MHG1-6]
MNKLTIITLALILSFQGLAQETETRNLSSFDGVAVSTAIEATLTKGSSEEIKIVSEGVALNDIITEVDGGRLKVYIDKSNNRRSDVKVYIVYKNLSSLKASSAGSIQVTDKIIISGDFEIDVSSAGDIKASIKADEIDIDASSAGDIKLTVEARSLEADLSSAADVEISGIVEELNVEASSSGEFSGDDLTCNSAELRASSGGSIAVGVKEKLKARASSGGSIIYAGTPKYLDKETSSGGSVRKD